MAEVGLSIPYEARYASSTFAYTAPSSCTCTLSRVIAVCGWIGNVVSLSERLYATLSMNGIAKFSPGEALQRSEAPLFRHVPTVCWNGSGSHAVELAEALD